MCEATIRHSETFFDPKKNTHPKLLPNLATGCYHHSLPCVGIGQQAATGVGTGEVVCVCVCVRVDIHVVLMSIFKKWPAAGTFGGSYWSISPILSTENGWKSCSKLPQSVFSTAQSLDYLKDSQPPSFDLCPLSSLVLGRLLAADLICLPLCIIPVLRPELQFLFDALLWIRINDGLWWFLMVNYR